MIFSISAGRHRNRVDDGLVGHVGGGHAGGRGAGVERHPIVRRIDPSGQAGDGGELIAHHPLSSAAPRRIVAVEPIVDVPLERAGGKREAIAERAAVDRATRAEAAHRPGLDLRVTAERAAARGGDDVDDTADGIAAIERRARAAQHLDAIGGDEVDVRHERGHVALNRRGVAEAQAVDEHRGRVGPQAANAHLRQLAGPAVVANLDAGCEAHDLGQRRLVTIRDLLLVDDAHRLRRLTEQLRATGAGDDDGIVDPGHSELDVHARHLVRHGERRHVSAEARLVHLNDERARRQAFDAVDAAGVGACGAPGVAVAPQDADVGAGHHAALRVGHAPAQGERLGEGRPAPQRQRHEHQHPRARPAIAGFPGLRAQRAADAGVELELAAERATAGRRVG